MHDNKLDISAPAGSGEEDVTAWALPEGATTRLGRGQIRKMAFSPDGTHLAVPTRIGCWLYDLGTMTHRALWATERGMVATISFSDDGAMGCYHRLGRCCEDMGHTKSEMCC